MAAILGMDAAKVIEGCQTVTQEFGTDSTEVVEAVNFNDPLQTVIAGSKAAVAQLGGGSDVALTPAPAAGFSGAPALDGDGRFAGIALLKPVLVAGPTNGIPSAQAVLVTLVKP